MAAQNGNTKQISCNAYSYSAFFCRCQEDARELNKKRELVKAGYIKITGKKNGAELSIEGAAPQVMQTLSSYGGPWKALTN